MLPRDEREEGGSGGYNERNEGWEDRRGGHQQSLLRPNYLSSSNDNTSFSPGRPALMAPGAMKVMGGAGITENLDRPNMPVTILYLYFGCKNMSVTILNLYLGCNFAIQVRQPVQERLVERSSRPSKRGGDREERTR